MKLRKLILMGFKSFADRTEFEFHDGITCIVGPNGCGKSNVVDAFKWVLGEQSAKSLRGAEMMDVIFNGSATRRPSGMAEVTLVFDDVDEQLTSEALGEPLGKTVSVSRRLTRGGHSEYRVNNTLCRLRDVREMFMDTGIGADAYSVIEQGRVEMFLNASNEDRRGIFDEAAGISRYKARKKEALRKLDRVEQNLARVNDILGEVEKRLRSVKLAAGKARNYQTHVERLRELKSLHYLSAYYRYAGRREDLQGQLDGANDRLAAAAVKLQQLEAAHRGAQTEAADLDGAVSELDRRLADLNARCEAAARQGQMHAQRAEELTEQIIAASHRCEELEAKLADATQHLAQREKRRVELQTESVELERRVTTAEADADSAERALTDLQDRLADEKDGTVDLLRRTSQLHSDVQATVVRREGLSAQQDRLSGRAKEIADSLARLVQEQSGLEARLADVREVIADSQKRLDEDRQQAGDAERRQGELQEDLRACRERRSALQGRIETLREMLAHLEGLSSGARDALAAARSGAICGVRGMLGDHVESDVDRAVVVEAALAGADQVLLVDHWADARAVTEELQRRLADRGGVEVLCLDRLAPLRQDVPRLDDPRIVAHVIDWLRFPAWVSPVVWRLLGATVVVETLADALSLSRQTSHLRFVTLAGEVLESDGRIRLGAAHRAAGVIRRRSELTSLDTALADLDKRIAAREADLRDVAHHREHLEQRIQAMRTANYEANTERVDLTGRVGHLTEQIDQLQQEEPVISSDLAQLAEDIRSAVQAEHEARREAEELDSLRVQREREVQRLTGQIEQAKARHEACAEAVTTAKLARVQADEKARAADEALRHLRDHRTQFQTDLDTQRQQVAADRRRRQETEQAAQGAAAQVTRLGEQRDQASHDLQDARASRQSLTDRLAEIDRQVAERRQEHETRRESLADTRTELSGLDVRVENVITRAADELSMDLVERIGEYQHDDQRDWEAVETEIGELNQKIERLGNVNLDAISEQDELEQRRGFLTEQLADVHASQKQLNELIDRLNHESHERFRQTFHAVRENFQQMFRKLFGGGRADLVLLDEDNVLECGIEVVARPPGKELKSLTLLSGGEKAKTALALIFSFFASRPSPFCLLDEVDAPLDEANTEQFGRLLRQFTAETQIVIISHAKRTMSMVDALYGVTMQEPGVSTQISVRFEEAADLAEAEPATASS